MCAVCVQRCAARVKEEGSRLRTRLKKGKERERKVTRWKRRGVKRQRKGNRSHIREKGDDKQAFVLSEVGKDNKRERASDEIQVRRCVSDVASEKKSEYEKKRESQSEGGGEEKRTCVSTMTWMTATLSLFTRKGTTTKHTHREKYEGKGRLAEPLFRRGSLTYPGSLRASSSQWSAV